VQDLRARTTTDLTALSVSLAARSGIPAPAAKWALEVWRKALYYFDKKMPPPLPDLEQLRTTLDGPPPMAPYRRSVAGGLLVALVGAVAGLLPGWLVPQGMARGYDQAIEVRRLVERHEPPGTRMTPADFTKWIGGLGALGGFIGAGVGWLGGGFHRPSTMRIVTGCIGALWAFDGAIYGAAYAGIIGALFGSMLTATIVVYLAGLIGPFAFLLALKPLAWFVVTHFA
jgi:hypothetical protein